MIHISNDDTGLTATVEPVFDRDGSTRYRACVMTRDGKRIPTNTYQSRLAAVERAAWWVLNAVDREQRSRIKAMGWERFVEQRSA